VDPIRSDVNAGLQWLTSPKERIAKRAELQNRFTPAKKQAKLDIENDNPQRHEKPMLMQLGAEISPLPPDETFPPAMAPAGPASDCYDALRDRQEALKAHLTWRHFGVCMLSRS